MFKIVFWTTLASFFAPLILTTDFFEYSMNFLTAGLVSGKPIIKIGGDVYGLVNLGFTLIFYAFLILLIIGKKVEKDVKEYVIAHTLKGLIESMDIEYIEGTVKKDLYEIHKPIKTKWFYREGMNVHIDMINKYWEMYEKLPKTIKNEVKIVEKEQKD